MKDPKYMYNCIKTGKVFIITQTYPLTHWPTVVNGWLLLIRNDRGAIWSFPILLNQWKKSKLIIQSHIATWALKLSLFKYNINKILFTFFYFLSFTVQDQICLPFFFFFLPFSFSFLTLYGFSHSPNTISDFKNQLHQPWTK